MKIDISIKINEDDLKKLMSYINITQSTIVNHNKSIQPDDDYLLTVTEASELLKVSRNVVSDLIKKNYITALRLGSLKIRHKEILNFLEKYNGKDVSYLDETPTLK